MANDTYTLAPDGSLYLGTARPVAASTSMETLADSMTAGQWARLQPDGDSTLLFWRDDVATANYLGDYMHRGQHDPIQKQLWNYGAGHGGEGRLIVYDEAGEAWSKAGPPPFWGPEGFHGYEHSAQDPSTGDRYFKEFNVTTINRWVRATNTWTTIADSGGEDAGHGTLSWLPTIGTQGGLVQAIGSQVKRWDKASNSWSTAGIIDGKSTAVMSAYSPVENVVFVGGGANFSTKWYMVSATGSPTAIADCPLSTNNTVGFSFVCPTSGHLIVASSNANAQRWNGTAWAALSWPTAPTFTCTEGDGSIVYPVHEYGVTVLVLGKSVGQMWLYKHA